MKQITSILLILIFASCTAIGQLNKKIDESQKSALESSPFNTANGLYSELKMQKKYRKQYENNLIELIKSNPNDTIILTENYDYICFGCPADYIQIFVRNKLISYRKQIQDKKYTMSVELLTENFRDSSGYIHSDIIELKYEIENGKGWNQNPRKYGTDNCFDGGHTFYTVIYPSGTIESMYMRCWTPKEFRKK